MLLVAIAATSAAVVVTRVAALEAFPDGALPGHGGDSCTAAAVGAASPRLAVMTRSRVISLRPWAPTARTRARLMQTFLAKLRQRGQGQQPLAAGLVLDTLPRGFGSTVRSMATRA